MGSASRSLMAGLEIGRTLGAPIAQALMQAGQQNFLREQEERRADLDSQKALSTLRLQAALNGTLPAFDISTVTPAAGGRPASISAIPLSGADASALDAGQAPSERVAIEPGVLYDPATMQRLQDQQRKQKLADYMAQHPVKNVVTQHGGEALVIDPTTGNVLQRHQVGVGKGETFHSNAQGIFGVKPDGTARLIEGSAPAPKPVTPPKPVKEPLVKMKYSDGEGVEMEANVPFSQLPDHMKPPSLRSGGAPDPNLAEFREAIKDLNKKIGIERVAIAEGDDGVWLFNRKGRQGVIDELTARKLALQKAIKEATPAPAPAAPAQQTQQPRAAITQDKAKELFQQLTASGKTPEEALEYINGNFARGD